VGLKEEMGCGKEGSLRGRFPVRARPKTNLRAEPTGFLNTDMGAEEVKLTENVPGKSRHLRRDKNQPGLGLNRQKAHRIKADLDDFKSSAGNLLMKWHKGDSLRGKNSGYQLVLQQQRRNLGL